MNNLVFGGTAMTSKFLIDNRWLLKLCSEAARFCGLLALFGTGVLVTLFVVMGMMMGESMPEQSRDQLIATVPTIAFYGFLALIFAEFISYLLAGEGEPKWILRHGSKVIYAYVVYFIAATVHMVLQTPNTGGLERTDLQHIFSLSLLVVSTGVKTLIWIGIGILLQKVVPIIRESKTLV
jgi:hypothetical protein